MQIKKKRFNLKQITEILSQTFLRFRLTCSDARAFCLPKILIDNL